MTLTKDVWWEIICRVLQSQADVVSVALVCKASLEVAKPVIRNHQVIHCWKKYRAEMPKLQRFLAVVRRSSEFKDVDDFCGVATFPRTPQEVEDVTHPYNIAKHDRANLYTGWDIEYRTIRALELAFVIAVWEEKFVKVSLGVLLEYIKTLLREDIISVFPVKKYVKQLVGIGKDFDRLMDPPGFWPLKSEITELMTRLDMSDLDDFAVVEREIELTGDCLMKRLWQELRIASEVLYHDYIAVIRYDEKWLPIMEKLPFWLRVAAHVGFHLG